MIMSNVFAMGDIIGRHSIQDVILLLEKMKQEDDALLVDIQLDFGRNLLYLEVPLTQQMIKKYTYK